MSDEPGRTPLVAESVDAADADGNGGPAKIAAGTPEFRRANLGLFAAGFATFALLYSVQPLLPEFSKEFGVSPATSSLALSLTTGLLAIALLAASSASEVVGRKPIMVASLFASALLTLALSIVPGWHALLTLRALTGVAISGLPAVAMAYLVDEMEKPAVGRAMGLYIAGSAFGGMSGRLAVAVLADHTDWRTALAVVGAIGLLSAVLFWRSLPPSRHFVAHQPDIAGLTRSLGAHLHDAGLRLLFLEAFLLMGAFVALYNYVGYRLLAPPYDLSQSAIGLIFASYLFGSLGSAWMGALADRFGRRKVLWGAITVMLAGIGLTLFEALWLIVAGIAVATFGFFGAHSIASSWVGLRAEKAKAQASALYLLAYYLGSSFAGWIGGYLWQTGGWSSVAGGIGALVFAALTVAIVLSRIPPPAWLRVDPPR